MKLMWGGRPNEDCWEVGWGVGGRPASVGRIHSHRRGQLRHGAHPSVPQTLQGEGPRPIRRASVLRKTVPDPAGSGRVLCRSRAGETRRTGAAEATARRCGQGRARLRRDLGRGRAVRCAWGLHDHCWGHAAHGPVVRSGFQLPLYSTPQSAQGAGVAYLGCERLVWLLADAPLTQRFCSIRRQDHCRGNRDHGHVPRAGPHRRHAAAAALPAAPLPLPLRLEHPEARPRHLVQGPAAAGCAFAPRTFCIEKARRSCWSVCPCSSCALEREGSVCRQETDSVGYHDTRVKVRRRGAMRPGHPRPAGRRRPLRGATCPRGRRWRAHAAGS